jgi:hypothetical protein
MDREPYRTEIETLTSRHIEGFLENYRHQVLAVTDRAREWLLLADEERAYYHEEFDRSMGDRYVLGLMHHAARLTQQQEEAIRRTDRLLVRQASLVAELFDFDVYAGYFELLTEPEPRPADAAYPQRDLVWRPLREK